MTIASFRFSTKILARLGEELNQTADQSISELVKNAYDADATKCSIELFEVGKPGGTIIISDDGDGMDAKVIRDNWLVLGHSGKSIEAITKLGRTPAGSKGLGRLAALRMGTEVHLQSVTRGNSRRINELNIDWSSFDDAKVVEDVQLTIETRKNSSGGHGTRTELIGLRYAIGSDELRRLARSLLLLTDPFGDQVYGFQITLVAPEYKEIESLIKKKYFDEASFHLRAELDEQGGAVARVLDWQSKELARADLAALRKSKTRKAYEAPAAVFDLWIFIFGQGEDAFSARMAGKGEVQNWVRQFGGVHVYQDGIRVAPYGNPGNDWLEMNLARVRSPEERPGTNTSIGRFQISGSGPHTLRQKTDRSGFIEDKSFQELRTFAKDALDWLARWRLDIAEQRRGKERSETPKAATAQRTKVETAIALAPPKARKAIQEAFTGYEKSRNKEADALRKEVQLYRTLSTAGITAATFSHESQGNPLKRIELGVTALKTRVPKLVKGPDRDKLLVPIGDIEKATAGLAILGTATLSLVKSTKRRVGKVLIHEVLNQLLTLLDPFISERTTEVQKVFSASDPFLRTSEAALESVFANLINNSLAAFERAGTADRRILLSTTLSGKSVEVHVADSGPGIADIKPTDIWLPGVTANPEGTGLGLTIVRDTVRDMGGEVSVIPHGQLGGAEFVVTLPILGS